jgi:hypothetical protein
VLENALDRCREEDILTPEVLAAIDLLALGAAVKWLFDQFRETLEDPGS